MGKKKEPAIVWREGDLIKILPVNSETIYFTDYNEKIYHFISNVRWRVMNGYLQGWVSELKQTIMLHHLILPKRDGFLCDHKNRNKADNRRSNLRYVTRTESQINRSMLKSNTTGYRGIVWVEKRNKWQAAIRLNKKKKWLGYFDTAEEARQVYIEALEKHYPGILYH